MYDLIEQSHHELDFNEPSGFSRQHLFGSFEAPLIEEDDE